MHVKLTLNPGQMQQLVLVMPTDIKLIAHTSWDYGTSIIVNRTESLVCYQSDTIFNLPSTEIIEISNAGMFPLTIEISDENTL